MSEVGENVGKDRAVWFLIGCVFCCLLLVLLAVFSHEKNKAQSPQALLAAVFGNGAPVFQEWQPGMGPQPLMYHPAAANDLVWKPLNIYPAQGAAQPDKAGSASGRPGWPLNWRPMVLNGGQQQSISQRAK